MPTPALPDFPLWGQITVVLGFLGAGIGIVRKAWKAEARPHESTDTVVVSAAFADSKPIKDLADAITSFNDAQASRSQALISAMEDMAREQGRSVKELQGIRDDIGRGVRVVATPQG